MAETHLHPSAEQIEHLQSLDLEGPVVMLNLLRFAPDGGIEEYKRYGKAAQPFLVQAGASVRLMSNVAATFIGGEDWDQIILVEYPTVQAFFDMVMNPDYPGDIRVGALSDSRLYCSQEPTQS